MPKVQSAQLAWQAWRMLAPLRVSNLLLHLPKTQELDPSYREIQRGNYGCSHGTRGKVTQTMLRNSVDGALIPYDMISFLPSNPVF